MTNRRTTRPARSVDPAALAALSGRVTALEVQRHDPNRRSVYVEEEFAVGLHEETVIRLGLKVGQQVDGRLLVEALNRDERKRAIDDAALFLGARPRSRREVEQKLARRYPPELIAGVLTFLEQQGYLDDAAFAKAWVDGHPNSGPHRLRADLLRKGVDRAIIDQVLEGSADRSTEALELARTRYRRMQGLDAQTARRRLYGFLVRRGFDFATAENAIRRLIAEGDDL